MSHKTLYKEEVINTFIYFYKPFCMHIYLYHNNHILKNPVLQIVNLLLLREIKFSINMSEVPKNRESVNWNWFLYCNSSQYILSTYNSQHNNNNVVLAMTIPYSGQGWRHNALSFGSCTMSSTLTTVLA
jgi:hypothetical protein